MPPGVDLIDLAVGCFPRPSEGLFGPPGRHACSRQRGCSGGSYPHPESRQSLVAAVTARGIKEAMLC